MDTELLIAQGNTHRENRQPSLALACYAQAFVQDPDSVSAWNNYGNVMREMGHPDRAIPFLEHAIRIDPGHETAKFNLAVSLLLMGNYEKGWAAYEERWNFEHLKGALPSFTSPRWAGENLKDKTILIIGEQGIGDTIQFSRFVDILYEQGAKVILAVASSIVSLFDNNKSIYKTIPLDSKIVEFDYWTPIMSIPGMLNMTLKNLYSPLNYISPDPDITAQWMTRLGFRRKLRVGFSWSGRRDTWINQHKSVPFNVIAEMIARNPQYEWVNLQVDASEEESKKLADIGCATYPGTIACLADSAALIYCMDVVVSVDTAVSHLSAALGKPTWVMLNQFALDWRWLLDRNDSPWYPTARLFRQPEMDDWNSVIKQIERHLGLFKI